MNSTGAALSIAISLFVASLGCIEIGFHIARRFRQRDPEASLRGIGGMEAAVFGLLGLLIAFNFGGAASRFESRRQLIISEANAIGTTLLRFDLLSPADRDAIRPLLRDYVDARLACHLSIREGRDDQASEQNIAVAADRLWKEANASLARLNSNAATSLLVSALNEMFDLGSSRIAATKIHPPSTILALLYALILIASIKAGYAMSARGRRAYLHTTLFALAMAVTVYITLDLEMPRSGIIRIDAMDQLIVNARDSITPTR